MDSSSQLPLFAVAAVSTLGIGLVSYILMKPSSKAAKKKSSASPSSTMSAAASSSSRSNSNNKDDVWEERRRKGIAPAKTSTSKTSGNVTTGDKPFGSSYYYAHNNSNAKGGYSDGLRMEDFTMNGPRLLSKGGKPVVVGGDENTSGNDNTEPHESTESDSRADGENKSDASNTNRNTIKRRILAISKYLWDDPGDKKGLATIRIDSLPDSRRSSESTIEWKDADVVEATAELIGETELIVIVKTKQEQEYRLHIKELYGKATSVQAIVKPKRLLVKLQKKKGFMQLSNVAAWPHPQQKVGQ
jgi:hypothetical protein